VIVDILVLGAAFALGTFYVGWWAIPIIALAWGWIVGPGRRPATRAAMGAAIAWMGFLAHDAVRGPAGRLVRTLGALFHLPGVVLLIVTVLFAMVLAWGAAVVGAETAPARPADRP
jgi:hypothetical protein